MKADDGRREPLFEWPLSPRERVSRSDGCGIFGMCKSLIPD